MPNNYRPRLPDYFEPFIERIKDLDEQGLNSMFNESAQKNSWDISDEGAFYEYKGTKSLRNLEDALLYCKADLTKWEVDRHVFNSWDVTMKGDDGPIVSTNYQVKIWFKKKDNSNELFYNTIKKEVSKLNKIKVNRKEGTGIGVVSMSDFHVGAEVRNLINTPDFSYEVLVKYINEAVETINSIGYDKVYLNLLGDFVESVTGLNHPNTWKSLGKGMYGAKVIIKAYELIKNHLISKIDNLYQVNIIAGNHDRFSVSSSIDNEGGVAALLGYFLRENSDIIIKDHEYLISEEIDGINYILTHGNHKLSQNEIKLIADYGRSDIYNVVLKGHLHTLKGKKTS